MWSCIRQMMNGGQAVRYSVMRSGIPIRYRNVLRLWQDDETFRTYFISLLADAEFAAYRWETPPVTDITVDRDFEFVLLDEPGLEQTPDANSFSDQFQLAGTDERVVTFDNLGRDAVLVVPCPGGPATAYAHLAAFVRGASPARVHELWQRVGAAMSARLGRAPVWLSTAGMGVSWLHVRLDTRPKYYGFTAYRQAT